MDIEANSITRLLTVSKIGDPTSKRSNRSDQFKMPKSIRNIKNFEFVGVSGNTSNLPYRIIRADYSIDTIPTVINGFLTIEKVDSQYYYARLKDGIADIGDRLKGLKLSDLPLSDLDHILTLNSFIESFTNTDGYIYAYADYGKGTSKAEFVPPSFFVSTIWGRIFNNIGVEYEGDFFTTDEDFLSELLPPSIGVLPVESAPTKTPKGSTVSNSISRYDVSDTYINVSDKHTLSQGSLTGFTSVGGNIVSAYSGRAEIKIDSSYSSLDCYVNISVRVNGSGKAYYRLDNGNGKTLSKTITLTLEVGDIISIFVNGVSYFEPTNDTDFIDNPKFSINYSVTNTVSISEVDGGLFVSANNIIGNMSQIDFIKDVANRHGLYMTPVNGNSNGYRFVKIDNVLRDIENAKDWTKKLVSIDNEEYRLELSKSNNLRFNYTKDIVNLYKDGVLGIDNENLNGEDTFFQSPFEIPLTGGLLFGETIYSIPLFGVKDSEDVALESPPKVMSLRRVSGTKNIGFFEDIPIIYDGEIPYLSLENIEMQYYVENNYRQYKVVMDRFKRISCTLNLSPIDIYNLRFDRLYFFAQAGRYYFLESIKNKAGENSIATFTEIFEFSENEAPSSVGVYSFTISKGSNRVITLDSITSDYTDREFDNPDVVRILTGFGSELKLFNNGIELTDQTDIPASDFNFKVLDTSESIEDRSYPITFTVSDTGSKSFSSDTGTITINVNAYSPVSPNANAGEDSSVNVDYNIPFDPFSKFLDGNGTTSNDEIESYLWEITSKPSGSNVYISEANKDNRSSQLTIPNNFNSIGVHKIRLTVTTVYGLVDTDEVTVTINNDSNNLELN